MEYFTLDNGLEVIFSKQKSTKVCSIYLGIKTGSVNESDEIAGISHFLEHLLFKGKATATIIESCGGYLNAYTSLDETVYYTTLPVENFQTGLKEVKNLVYNAYFSKEEVELEKNIIIEELKSGKDNPLKLLYEKVFENTYQEIGYKRPVIGKIDSIKNLSFETILNYYKKNYSPNNSTLVIVGDLEKDSVKKIVENEFNGLRPDFERIFIPENIEPEKNSFKIISEKHNFNQKYVAISFKVPDFKSIDFISLDVFSNFFGSGQSSHLVRKLK